MLIFGRQLITCDNSIDGTDGDASFTVNAFIWIDKEDISGLVKRRYGTRVNALG